jgi:hydrogenase maturation factor
MPEVGKISPDIFSNIILSQLGRTRPEVVVPPQNGVDVGVVDIGGGRVMVTTTDPVFVVPAYGWERAAWFAVNILASDAATSGLPPQYITFDLNLPLDLARGDFDVLWSAMHRECDRLGLAVISGHTGKYQGCNYPMVGGATVIAIGPGDRYVTPAMARPGDAVLVTKGAAIEAAGLFAVTFPRRVADAFGPGFARAAEEIFWQMSVVDDALTAVGAGVRDDGVTAMHDATECGVYGGLFEIAQASGVGMIIQKEEIIVAEKVGRICELFEIDPYTSISEGTLLITCRPHKAADVLSRLQDKGIPVSRVGDVTPEADRIVLCEGTREHPLAHPRVDPFWGAFAREAAKAQAS